MSPVYFYEELQIPRKQIRLLTDFPNRNKPSIIEMKLSVYPIPPSNAPRHELLQAHLKLPWYFAVPYV